MKPANDMGQEAYNALTTDRDRALVLAEGFAGAWAALAEDPGFNLAALVMTGFETAIQVEREACAAAIDKFDVPEGYVNRIRNRSAL